MRRHARTRAHALFARLIERETCVFSELFYATGATRGALWLLQVMRARARV